MIASGQKFMCLPYTNERDSLPMTTVITTCLMVEEGQPWAGCGRVPGPLRPHFSMRRSQVTTELKPCVEVEAIAQHQNAQTTHNFTRYSIL